MSRNSEPLFLKRATALELKTHVPDLTWRQCLILANPPRYIQSFAEECLTDCNTFAERESLDGWRTYVWVSGTFSAPIVFVPSHLYNRYTCPPIKAFFDDFTVCGLDQGPVGYRHPSERLRTANNEYELSDPEERVELFARLGRLYVRERCTAWNWLYPFPYFTLHRDWLSDSLLDIGPGASGLNLFWGRAFIGILSGCYAPEQNFLVFLNVRYVAGAVRMAKCLRCADDVLDSGVGPLRWVLNRDAVELWNATDGYKFASSVASNKSSADYRVAFLLYMCQWKAKKAAGQQKLTTEAYLPGDRKKTVVKEWVRILEHPNANLSKLPCTSMGNVGFKVATDINDRLSAADVTPLKRMILTKPHVAQSYFPYKLFYAACVATGRKTVSGCWLPDTLHDAYRSARCCHNAADRFLPATKHEVGKTWFASSELPYKDAVSVEFYNLPEQERVTACHHPFLCEISESPVQKATHAPHSHTCVRLSHLEMAPKRVNKHHEGLQNKLKVNADYNTDLPTRKRHAYKIPGVKK
jgi:hypothetical protein